MIADLKPYPEYKDAGLTWLGKVPSTWKIVRNGSLFGQRNDTGHGDLPILEVSLKTGVRVRDFEGSSRKQVMSDAGKYKRAAKGDIAYNMMRMWQGAVGVSPVDGLVSPAYVVARPYRHVDPSYFVTLFRTGDYISEIDNCSRGIVKDRNRLYWGDFKQMLSPCPPLQEQKAIVRFLAWTTGRLSRAIQAKRTVLALFNEQKQVIIHTTVTRGLDSSAPLRQSGISGFGKIPSHWEVRKLVSACALIVDGTHFSPQSASTGEFLYITAKNIKEHGVNTATASYISAKAHSLIYPRCPVKKGDVLYIKDGATAGLAAVNSLDTEFSMLSSVALLRASCALIPGYLALSLNEKSLREYALSRVVGGAMTRFTISIIKKIPIRVPPIAEQERALAVVESLSAPLRRVIERTEREIELLHEYRAGLVADVVTGKLDVRAAAANLPVEIPGDTADVATDIRDEIESLDEDLIN